MHLVPRPREFNEETALDKALALFWSRGYAATNMDDLHREMQLSRSSFYLAFGSKHDLFLRCVDRYTAKVGAALQAHVKENTTALTRVDRLLRTVLAVTGPQGCFLGNTSLELGARDATVRKHVAAGLAAVEDIFARVLRDGVDAGELDAKPAAAARLLTSNLQGILVMAKAGIPPAALNTLRDAALRSLNWREPQ